VRSVGIDDGERGLSRAILDFAEVLVWWGHVRHPDIKENVGRAIVFRIKNRGLTLVALHSAHWATPFMEAMNERSRDDVRKFPDGRVQVRLHLPNCCFPA
jgi:trehalose utilization protein